MDIEGTLVSAPAPLGWRVVQDGLTVDLCAEPLIGSAHGAFGRQAAGAAESFGRGGPYPHVDFNARY